MLRITSRAAGALSRSFFANAWRNFGSASAFVVRNFSSATWPWDQLLFGRKLPKQRPPPRGYRIVRGLGFDTFEDRRLLAVDLSIGDASHDEANYNVAFVVSLAETTPDTVTVVYNTANITAAAGSDT